MKIIDVPGVIRVGEIVYSENEYTGSRYVLHKTKLKLNYDSNFPKNLKKQHVSMVYIFCVNENIVKIGQSSSKTGIQSCLNFYLTADKDSSGSNRFSINWLIREELKKNHKVEVYMIYKDPVTTDIPGLFKSAQMIVPVSAKAIEENCLSQYYIIEDSYPKWNFQENNEEYPTHIKQAYAQYKMDCIKK